VTCEGVLLHLLRAVGAIGLPLPGSMDCDSVLTPDSCASLQQKAMKTGVEPGGTPYSIYKIGTTRQALEHYANDMFCLMLKYIGRPPI
jgi:hypothetical protein